jgi:acetylornithine deacetylase
MTSFSDSALLALHREIVAIPSVSGNEDQLCTFLCNWLAAKGVKTERLGNTLYAVTGTSGPLVCFNSHLDTVPPAAGKVAGDIDVSKPGVVTGLGSNDAKASVAAMIAAFLRLRETSAHIVLTLVDREETGGRGAEALMPELRARGLWPDFAIIGEPTNLDIAIAQKGLLILELVAKGEACHAAHRHALGVDNAIRNIARDLTAIDDALTAGVLGKPHPLLGEITVEPTMINGGTARNVNPASANCFFDIRVNPTPTPAEITERLRKYVKNGELKIFSERLQPYEVDSEHPFVAAALRAARAVNSEAKTFGSRGLSDLVFFRGIPAVKAGPGITERSHTPDEFVLESEIIKGACFFENVVREASNI